MADIPSMSLKVAPLQFANFTPTTYKMETADPTLLAKSLTMQEAREKEASQNIDAIDSVFSKIRENLDVSEHPWLETKANEIRNRLDIEAAHGNYQSAIRMAKQEMINLKRDTELQDKVTVSNAHKKFIESLNSARLDEDTKRRMKELNPYKFDGTATWKQSVNFVDDININSLFSAALGLTSEDAQSTSTSRTVSGQILTDDNGKSITNVQGRINKNASGSDMNLDSASGIKNSFTRGGSSSLSTHIKTPKRIEKTFRDLLADGNIRAAVSQKYDTMVWAYHDALKRANDETLSPEARKQASIEASRYLKDISGPDNKIISSDEEWIEKKLRPMFYNMAYHNTSRSNTVTIGDDFSNLVTGNVKRKQGGASVVTEDADTKGNPITVTTTPGIINNTNSDVTNADSYISFF